MSANGVPGADRPDLPEHGLAALLALEAERRRMN
jgi:hypothetical protein